MCTNHIIKLLLQGDTLLNLGTLTQIVSIEPDQNQRRDQDRAPLHERDTAPRSACVIYTCSSLMNGTPGHFEQQKVRHTIMTERELLAMSYQIL